MSEESQDSKNSGRMYAMTRTPSIKPHSYSAGPTPEINMLLALKVDEGIAAEIHRLHEDADPDVVYRWDGKAWVGEDKPKADPLPWEAGPAAQLIMDEMRISEQGGGVWMFEAKCVGFTVESKARPGEYEMVRGYQQFETDYDLRLPIHNAHRLVDDGTGNLDLLSQAFRTIARTLDMDVFTVASERVDRKVAVKDTEATRKAQRFDAGKGYQRKEVAAQKPGETL